MKTMVDMGEKVQTDIEIGVNMGHGLVAEAISSTPEFKNLISRNLMVYTFPHEEYLIGYQVEMISNNQIKGLLKADFTKINGKACLQYDITSLICIKKLFKRRKINRDNFISIIKQITDLIDSLEQYLLEYGGIIFDSNYVFADPQHLTLGFTYIPVKQVPSNIEDLKGFLLNLIINDISFVDEPSDNYVRKLIEVLKDKEFSISTLKDYLCQINDNLKPKLEPHAEIKKEAPKKNIRRILSSTQVSEENILQDKLNISRNDFRKTRGITDIPLLPKSNKEDIPPVQPEGKIGKTIDALSNVITQKPIKKIGELVGTTKLCYPSKSYTILFSVIGGLIVFGVVLILTGILSPINPDFLLGLFAFLLIGGAIIYLIYSKLFRFDKKVERKIYKQRVDFKQNKEQNTYGSFPVPNSIRNFDFQKNGYELGVQKAVCSPHKSSNYDFSTVVKQQENYLSKRDAVAQEGTVLLNVATIDLPHLKSITDNSNETIIIKSFPFMIGRLEEQVDYCISNPVIGKLHAEITKNIEGYFISDMNSKNGTFINGVRIDPSKEKPIQNEDHITLGNEEFIFCYQ